MTAAFGSTKVPSPEPSRDHASAAAPSGSARTRTFTVSPTQTVSGSMVRSALRTVRWPTSVATRVPSAVV